MKREVWTTFTIFDTKFRVSNKSRVCTCKHHEYIDGKLKKVKGNIITPYTDDLTGLSMVILTIDSVNYPFAVSYLYKKFFNLKTAL